MFEKWPKPTTAIHVGSGQVVWKQATGGSGQVVWKQATGKKTIEQLHSCECDIRQCTTVTQCRSQHSPISSKANEKDVALQHHVKCINGCWLGSGILQRLVSLQMRQDSRNTPQAQTQWWGSLLQWLQALPSRTLHWQRKSSCRSADLGKQAKTLWSIVILTWWHPPNMWTMA